jgi:hypothetical protein
VAAGTSEGKQQQQQQPWQLGSYYTKKLSRETDALGNIIQVRWPTTHHKHAIKLLLDSQCHAGFGFECICLLLLPSTNVLVQGPDTTLELLSGDRKLQLAVQVIMMLLVLRVLRCCPADGKA